MDEDLGRCSIQAFWNCTGCSKVRSNGTLESTKEMPLDGRRIAQGRGCQSNKHRSIGKLAATPKNNHPQKVARCSQQRV